MNTILYFQSPSQTSAPDKVTGVRQHASAIGWHVQPVEGIPSQDSLDELIRFWNPIGIIVECGGGYHEIPTEMFSGLPTVYLDRNPRSMPPNTSCVSHDSVATGRLAAKELLVTGHPNFAFVPYPLPRFWSDDREQGFREALAINGRSCETFNCRNHSPQSVIWQKALQKWILRLPKPCGIFAANDNIAAEVLSAAIRSGCNIPNDIAICGVDNFSPICEHTSPTLTSIQPNFLHAGELAARTLEEIIRGKRDRTIRLTFGPASIVRRASSRTGIRCDPEVTSALELIRRNACKGLTAAEVTAAFKCSRRMAEMKFRQITNHSILDEIQSVRLEKAKELLANSSMDLATIANFCGFKAPNALWKFFRQETGKPPSQWRSEQMAPCTE